MSDFRKHFNIDHEKAKSREAAIFQGQKYRITILSDILVRIEYNSEGRFEDRPTEFALNRDFEVPLMTVNQDDRFLSVATKYFKLEYNKESNLYPRGARENNLRITLANTDKVWYINHPEARNFFGSEVSLDNAAGKIPLLKGLFSSDGFVSVDDSKSLIFDEGGTLSKNPDDRVDMYVFFYRKDFGYCLRDYFLLTGKPPMIPRYALGVWWHRNIRYNELSVKHLIEDFHHYQIPLSVLLLGEHWHIKDVGELKNLVTGFSFNRELFPNPEDFTKYLHSKHVRLGLRLDPSQGIMNHEEKYKDFVTALGIPDKTETIPFNIFDSKFLNSYFTTIIDHLHRVGVDFFFIDYYNKNSLASLRALNHYHFTNFKQDKSKRGMILSRNGLTASHRYPVLYSGQTLVSWKMLKFLPYFNSNSSNVGLSWWSHDVCGYKDGIEDGELYMRYVQLGTFSPIFRFAAKEGKYYKREPWSWEVKIETIVREYTQLRHKLIPYIYSEAYKYHRTGMPFILPLYYKYPETYDEPAYINEYYFGSELFVAPITNVVDDLMKRVVERIFIPEGIWYEFKSGKKVPGDKKYVFFYKEEDYPVFAKSGAIIPMAEISKDLNNTNNPETLDIHIFPGQSNVYRMYEDDGISSLYEDGYYLLTEFKYDYKPNNYTFTIKPAEGKLEVIGEKRSYKIRFRNTKLPQYITVKVADQDMKCPAYVDSKDFVIEIPFVPTSATVIINCHGNDIDIDALRLVNEDIDSIINDLLIETSLKEKISDILFGTQDIRQKRIEIRKLKKHGLSPLFSKLFLRLLEYIGRI